MKKLLQGVLHSFGLQLKKFPDPKADADMYKRMRIMQYCGIDTVLDVGANDGQYVLKMRKFGFKGRMVSYEPLKQAFDDLQKTLHADKNWQGYNYALGSEDTISEINIAGNSYSSSLLNMLPTHEKSAPTSRYIGKQQITVKKLDSIFSEHCNGATHVMLKIDTQGYEKFVLDGALQVLPNIDMVQMEMSLVPLYENEMLYMDLIAFMKEKGFELYLFENGFSDKHTGRLLQVDGVFVNKHSPKKIQVA
jgi:FkbM family methyltransferase